MCHKSLQFRNLCEHSNTWVSKGFLFFIFYFLENDLNNHCVLVCGLQV
jgi:hypothetical protein